MAVEEQLSFISIISLVTLKKSFLASEQISQNSSNLEKVGDSKVILHFTQLLSFFGQGWKCFCQLYSQKNFEFTNKNKQQGHLGGLVG